MINYAAAKYIKTSNWLAILIAISPLYYKDLAALAGASVPRNDVAICVKLVNLSTEFGGIIAIFGFLNDRCASNNSLHMKTTVVRNQAAPHPLFDPEFYLARYPDVASSGLDPFAHFLTRGVLEHRSPHPLFDARYYVENNSDVTESGNDPLLHFLETGAFEGRKPIPLFDPRFYFENNPEVAAQRINPLIHYLESGASQGQDPHPLFDTDWYVSQHPEVAASGTNPLVHYVLVGIHKGYKPTPHATGIILPDFDADLPYLKKPVSIPSAGRQDIETSAVRTVDLQDYRLDLQDIGATRAQLPKSFGVFVHVFYEDIWEEIASALEVLLPFHPDIYLSTDSDYKKIEIEAGLARHRMSGRGIVKVFPNQGRDIGPFVVGFAKEIREHEICLRLHTKKSSHAQPSWGLAWRSHLLSELIGDSERVKSLSKPLTRIRNWA